MNTKKRIKNSWLYKQYFRITHRKLAKQREISNALFKKEGKNVLSLFADALNKCDVTFWLEFGTLLGYYREKGFIAHDDDLDTGIFIENRDKAKMALEAEGFKRISYFRLPDVGIIEECYQHQTMKTSIDVFYFQKEGDLMYSHIMGYTKPLEEILNSEDESVFKVHRAYFPMCSFKGGLFNGIKVKVPEKVAEHLAYHYGDDFMIPDPNFTFEDRRHVKSFELDEIKAYGIIMKEKIRD